MKKVLMLLAGVWTLASCSNLVLESSPSTAMAGDNRAVSTPVGLISAESYARAHYGISSVDRNFSIKVQNLSSTKTVVIHHSRVDGTWIDIPASYQGAAEPGYEIWTASYGWNLLQNTSYDLGDGFVVKMTANGQTYWDNNGGINYKLTQHGGPLLGKGIKVLQSYANGYRGWSESVDVSFYGGILVQNEGYTKKVNIVYTTDGWKTTKVGSAIYNSSWMPSYASPIPSPNSNGVELWTWSLSIPLAVNDAFEYAISYDVNGVTYWDNNNGKNYKKSDIVK